MKITKYLCNASIPVVLLTAILLSISVTSSAQTSTSGRRTGKGQYRRDRGYKVEIVNKSNTPLDTITKGVLEKAFFSIYPKFAQADGYQTKTEVTLELSDDLPGSMTAKAGEIVVNRNWLNKNSAALEKELLYQFSKNWISVDTLKRNGYSLVFISKDPDLNQDVKKNLIDTYFKVYPTLVKTFNKTSTKDVLFVVDTAYNGVAEASGNRILFSSKYLQNNPTDIDVVTHETMHIAQGYGYSAGPVWLTEGIADYVRYKYGVDNIGSKWSLPDFDAAQNYTDSYRITARFFEWLEQNVKKGLISKLDEELRAHTYTEQSWATLTGKSIDELWAAYSKSPAVKLKYSGK